MSPKGYVRHHRASKGRNVSSKHGRTHARRKKLRADNSDAEILKLVRAGVERFILNNASIEDFFKTIRIVAEREKIYSHQLTRSAFSGIVKAAIKLRNLRLSRRAAKTTHRRTHAKVTNRDH